MILIDLPKICFRNILPFDPPDWNEIMPSTRITSVHKDQTRLQDVIGITYINLVSLADIFPFSWYIQFSSIDIRRVLLKPEGKSIVQHTAFIYRTMSGKRSSRGNTCNEDVYGRSLRCKTTCTLFPHKKAIQLDLCKALWPLTSFLEVHTADHCSLPISRWPWQTNLWHYFAYHVKNLNSTAQWTYNSNGEESNDTAALKQREVDWVGEELRGWAAVYLLGIQNLLSLHEQKKHVCKENAGLTLMWTGLLWRSGIPGTLRLCLWSKCSRHVV